MSKDVYVYRNDMEWKDMEHTMEEEDKWQEIIITISVLQPPRWNY